VTVSSFPLSGANASTVAGTFGDGDTDFSTLTDATGLELATGVGDAVASDVGLNVDTGVCDAVASEVGLDVDTEVGQALALDSYIAILPIGA
jgi:hypothetical protein